MLVYEPNFKLFKKDQPIQWNEDCKRAFYKIKDYSFNPLLLVPPMPSYPLLLYLDVHEASMGCVLSQRDEARNKEREVYYLRKRFVDYKTRYFSRDNLCSSGVGHQAPLPLISLICHPPSVQDEHIQILFFRQVIFLLKTKKITI